MTALGWEHAYEAIAGIPDLLDRYLAREKEQKQKDALLEALRHPRTADRWTAIYGMSRKSLRGWLEGHRQPKARVWRDALRRMEEVRRGGP